MNKLPFLCRCDTAEHGIFIDGLPQIFRRLQSGSVDVLVCVGNACLGRYLGNGNRIISGNYLNGNPLFGEETEGFVCILPDFICDNDQRVGDNPAGKGGSVRLSLVFPKHENTVALFSLFLDGFPVGVVILAENKLRCAKHIASSGKGDRAVFICR